MSARVDRWAEAEAALREIKPDIDAAGLEACKARIDPDYHRAFFDRAEHPYMSRWQIVELRKVIEPALAELRRISPQAWFMLRMIAHKHHFTLPGSPKSPAWPFTPPSLVEHLAVVLLAADELGRPPSGPRPRLMLERAVACACVAVYRDLCGKCPPTTHPDQRTKTLHPYHRLVEAVFGGWQLDNWEDRATEAAKEWRAAVRG